MIKDDVSVNLTRATNFMNIKELRNEFQGKWVMKKGISPFRVGDEILPLFKVEQLNVKNNGRISLHTRKNKAETIPESLVIISEEDSRKILKIWNESQSISECPDQSYAHVREDTGEEKQKYNQNDFQFPLFRLKMKYPDKNFSSYKCPVCGFIHIGKISETNP